MQSLFMYSSGPSHVESKDVVYIWAAKRDPFQMLLVVTAGAVEIILAFFKTNPPRIIKEDRGVLH